PARAAATVAPRSAAAPTRTRRRRSRLMSGRRPRDPSGPPGADSSSPALRLLLRGRPRPMISGLSDAHSRARDGSKRAGLLVTSRRGPPVLHATRAPSPADASWIVRPRRLHALDE